MTLNKEEIKKILPHRDDMLLVDDVTEEDRDLLGYIMLKIKDLAKDLGLENGYRVVNNCGEDGFQTVRHLHVHLLGKRKMTWPPG